MADVENIFRHFAYYNFQDWASKYLYIFFQKFQKINKYIRRLFMNIIYNIQTTSFLLVN